MTVSVNTGTRDVPLKFAKELTAQVNKAWEDGSFFSRTSPVTQDLLRFWFNDTFCESRSVNFHLGQKQAILNVVYLHEILKTDSVFDMYSLISDEVAAEMDLAYLKKDKFSHPKYCLKMATGTGKTWVLNALLIWQYLNAKFEETPCNRFSKRFLIVAPGLIVYERLLDAYLGKEDLDGTRNFETSDFRKYEVLFIPPAYKEMLFAFIQTNVIKKEEIAKKVTGDGMIAITNWHLLVGEEEEETSDISPLEDPSAAVKELLPVTPGTSAGHALESLDNQYLSGGEIEYLAGLDHLVVFNDEAHHIHETKKAGIVSEVEWQKSLNRIAEAKGNRFIQIDFSATPYDVTGSGQKRTKHYFPHIIMDFDLKTAIHKGLVKTITLDKRKELATMELDFKAVREGNRVVGLSDGQKLMLRAGLQKLKILEQQFVGLTKDKSGMSDKHPKMLVVCEDTNVSPLVVDFLKSSEGLGADDVVQIDSDRKGSIPAKEWQEVKQRLFNMDRHEKPKVVVSVLMLREGFDVSNICVIVPLRSTQAPILLEQIIGRGLRLMWRESDYKDVKEENRVKLLQKKEEPSNYLDILSIVEHRAFIEFYDDLVKEGVVGESHDLPVDRESILGDIIRVGLKENYKDYDLYWPIIVQDKEEILHVMDPSAEYFAEFDWYSLDQLKEMAPKEGESFISEEVTVKTRFGEYHVAGDLFTAKSYNEFLAKIVKVISGTFGTSGRRGAKNYPFMQINNVMLVKVIDDFIKNRLFNQPFDPFVENNWRVLLLSQAGITQHIIKEVSQTIYDMQNNIRVEDAVVIKKFFSEIDELKMRENFSLEVAKTIYERLKYPSNKGDLEKNFILYCDGDPEVNSFLKIDDYYHSFAHINYIRTDGMLSPYYPDFIVKIGTDLYLVETKAQKDVKDANVRQKELGTLYRLKKINELNPEDRMGCDWHYVLLGETTFYTMRDKGASIKEIMEFSKLTRQKVEGRLF